MKKIIILIVTILTGFPLFSQDLIILRSGEEVEGKVLQASQTAVHLEQSKGGIFSKGQTKLTFDPKEIYMIKYKERGNLYFKEDGSRVTGEKHKIDKSASVIYLCDGKEIQAWDLTMDSQFITFRSSKKAGYTRLVPSAVFMIKYTDGSKDIITDITPQPEIVEETTVEEVVPEPQIRVIFHTVKAGDTLAKIAELYNVTIPELREWNEIEASIKDGSKLKIGTQYMIQQIIE